MPYRRSAYTLVELLTALGIMGLLAALLFPAFSMVREAGRRSSCTNNLRQLGLALDQYIQDYERYPRGLDFADKYTPEMWQGELHTSPQLLAETPLLPTVMSQYVTAQGTWKCPSDSGLDEVDLTGLALDGRPSCAAKFGMSYVYRTEVTLLDLNQDHLPRPTETNILSDGSGDWHGGFAGTKLGGKRYNVLFGDGHVKNVQREAYMDAWSVPIQ